MKINFNRVSVILLYIAIFLVPIMSMIIGAYPPDMFIICWFVFWLVQSIVDMNLHINKKTRSLIEQYVNKENADKIIEKYVGIKPSKKGESHE